MKNRIWLVLALCVIISACNKKTTAKVVGHEWKRTTAVLDFSKVQEEDWTIPQGGEKVNSVQKQHHTVPGKCYGSHFVFVMGEGYKHKFGSYDCQKPVMMKYYTFMIDRWHHTRSVTVSGNNLKPYWPELGLKGKEKPDPHGYVEELRILFEVEGAASTTHVTCSRQDWEKYKKGDYYNVVLDYDGKVVSIGDLALAEKGEK